MRKNKRAWNRGPHFRDRGISRARMMVDMWKFERKYCFIGLGTIQEAVRLYHRASRRHARVQIEEMLEEMWVEGVDGVRPALCILWSEYRVGSRQSAGFGGV